MSEPSTRTDQLVFADGTVWEDSYVLYSDMYLYVYVKNGSTLKDVFDLLIVPENTARIEATRYGTTEIYEGFTRLISVRDEGRGMISASLRER